MTTNATADRFAPIRRAAVAFTLALFGLHGAPAVAAPARTVVADLRGVTTITWSGNAAIRLRVPKDVLVGESSYRLTARRGSFVSIRGVPVPQPIGCKRDYGLDWCAVVGIDWLKDVAETGGHGTFATDPSRDFYATLNDPPVVSRGSWDLYLFTDRSATVEIRAPGLSGRASYVAGGRFTGRAVATSGPCRLATCSTDALDQRYGGDAFDVGRAGLVQTIVYGRTDAEEIVPGLGAAGSFLLRGCAYPNADAPDASADPAKHPSGCDVAESTTPADATNGATAEAGTGLPARGRTMWGAGSYQASGRVYLGFRATAVAPGKARLGALLIWLRYGIT